MFRPRTTRTTRTRARLRVPRRALSYSTAGLATAEPEYGELWSFFGRRPQRPGDPGPVRALSVEDLATLIDRRARFDPPQRPAPVGPAGYSVLVGNHRRPSDPLYLSLTVRAGAYRDSSDNSVEIEINPNGPAWQNEGVMRRIFEGGVPLWSAEWGAVWHRRADEDRLRQWPRLAWTADRFRSHSVPPYVWEYPFPFPFEEPAAVGSPHPQLGGELEAWDWPPRTSPPPSAAPRCCG